MCFAAGAGLFREACGLAVSEARVAQQKADVAARANNGQVDRSGRSRGGSRILGEAASSSRKNTLEDGPARIKPDGVITDSDDLILFAGAALRQCLTAQRAAANSGLICYYGTPSLSSACEESAPITAKDAEQLSRRRHAIIAYTWFVARGLAFGDAGGLLRTDDFFASIVNALVDDQIFDHVVPTDEVVLAERIPKVAQGRLGRGAPAKIPKNGAVEDVDRSKNPFVALCCTPEEAEELAVTILKRRQAAAEDPSADHITQQGAGRLYDPYREDALFTSRGRNHEHDRNRGSLGADGVWDLNGLIQKCERRRFLRLQAFLHESKGDYRQAVDARLRLYRLQMQKSKDLQGSGQLASGDLLSSHPQSRNQNEADRSRQGSSTQQATKAVNGFFEYVVHLLRETGMVWETLDLQTLDGLSREETCQACLVGGAKFGFARVGQSLSGLPLLRIRFLEQLFFQHEWANEAEKLRFREEHVLALARLMCEYKRQEVATFLRKHEAILPLEEALEMALQFQLNDAAAFLLEKVGDYSRANELFVRQLRDAVGKTDEAEAERPAGNTKIQESEEPSPVAAAGGIIDVVENILGYAERCGRLMDPRDLESFCFAIFHEIFVVYSSSSKSSSGRGTSHLRSPLLRVVRGLLLRQLPAALSVQRITAAYKAEPVHLLQETLGILLKDGLSFQHDFLESSVAVVGQDILQRLTVYHGTHRRGTVCRSRYEIDHERGKIIVRREPQHWPC
ncbi:unnamed protein product [Amoebophrya sp. A25]|nr:unnamed protein product [Amoebophrya sp. A25]|eukprot:GSA25T00025339001.1